MTTTFCVGNVNPGEVRAEFMHGMMDLAQNPMVGECEFQGYWSKSPSGPYLDVARNFVVERFLNDTTADVLLFIDSDIEFSRESVEQVVSWCNPDVVNGGFYVSAFPGKGIRPVAFDWDEDNVLQPIEMPVTGIAQNVDVVGTGFMAIHRVTLEAMLPIFGYPSPWFAEEVMHGSAMGEDVTFCQRVIHGLKCDVVIDFHASVNHIKPIKLTPSTRIY